MSHLSLLFASPASSVLPPARRKTADRRPEGSFLDPSREFGFCTREFSVPTGENDCALPSGIASMEHWLDLNA
jgi:hypothetical protein